MTTEWYFPEETHKKYRISLLNFLRISLPWKNIYAWHVIFLHRKHVVIDVRGFKFTVQEQSLYSLHCHHGLRYYWIQTPLNVSQKMSLQSSNSQQSTGYDLNFFHPWNEVEMNRKCKTILTFNAIIC